MEDSLVFSKHASRLHWFKSDLTDVLAVNQVVVELLASGNINLLLRTLTRHTGLQSFTNWPAHPPPCCSITRKSPGQHLHCQLPTCYLSTRQPANLPICQPVKSSIHWQLVDCQPVNLLQVIPLTFVVNHCQLPSLISYFCLALQIAQTVGTSATNEDAEFSSIDVLLGHLRFSVPHSGHCLLFHFPS